MALVPSTSEQYDAAHRKPVSLVHAADWNAGRKSSYGILTFTGAAGQGSATMLTLPAGRKIIFPYLSRIVCAAASANCDLHVGHSQYKQPDGTVVAANPAAIADDLDLGAGPMDRTLNRPTTGYLVIDSIDDVDIVVMIDTANGPIATEVMLLFIEWASAGK